MSVITELERLIGRIDALIAALPERGVEYDYDRWNAWRTAEEAAFDTLLADEGGKSRQQGGDAIYLRMAGVSSSSTSGRAQLMRNWQWAARRRIAKLRQGEAEAATPITTVKMTGSTVAKPHSKKENGMNFGQAIEALKAGMKVARAGWNGKGMFLIFVPGTLNVVPREGSPYASVTAAAININPHIDMKTATGEMQPGWLASQTDMLAEDWEVVE